MIRPARPADAAAVAAIWNPVIRTSSAIFSSEERSIEEVARLIEQDCWLWAEGDAVLAFVRIFPFRSGNGYAHTVEQTIMVSPPAKGRGIGRALVEHAAAAARAAGKHSLWAAVSAENGPGLAFHRACGFTEHGRLPEVGWKFGRWHDVVLMGRML